MTEEQGVYNASYGHMGEQDSIISIVEGVKQGRPRDGDVMVIVAAGIGWVRDATASNGDHVTREGRRIARCSSASSHITLSFANALG